MTTTKRTFGTGEDVLTIEDLNVFDAVLSRNAEHRRTALERVMKVAPLDIWFRTHLEIGHGTDVETRALAYKFGKLSLGPRFPIPWILRIRTQYRSPVIDLIFELKVTDRDVDVPIEVKTAWQIDVRHYNGMANDDGKPRLIYEAKRLITMVLTHEVEEHLTYEGVRVYNPHANDR